MIYYWLHMFYIYVGSKFIWEKVELDSDLTRVRKVSILDCDSLRYMANSKYFYYMDFIRFEVLFRSTDTQERTGAGERRREWAERRRDGGFWSSRSSRA